ncbi:MAG: guanylate kinase [Verrucomicrobiia bacterium]|jgi:guanylate kinase
MEGNEKFFQGLNAPTLLIVVSAPSGAGKTTLCNNLLKADSNIVRAITCTTRAPRANEENGIDYYFLRREQFEEKIKGDEFLEYANVYGNYYGTLREEVFAKFRLGKDVLLNIDVQGAQSVRMQAKGDERLRRSVITVFIGVESIRVLEERLRKRGLDDEESLKKRLNFAREEIRRWKEFDYLIISSTMDEDLRRLRAIVEAERLRVGRLI